MGLLIVMEDSNSSVGIPQTGEALGSKHLYIGNTKGIVPLRKVWFHKTKMRKTCTIDLALNIRELYLKSRSDFP